MKISRVELKPDETVVHVLLKQRTDRPLIQPDHLCRGGSSLGRRPALCVAVG